jgi:acyl carrier protein
MNTARQQQIRDFILRQFPLARRPGISDGDSLIDGGIIDSMGVLDIVSFLESEFDIVLDADEVASDTFDSINTLAACVERKLAGQ